MTFVSFLSGWGDKPFPPSLWLVTLNKGFSPLMVVSTNYLILLLCCNIMISEVAQSCLTLCDPMGSSLPGSSVHGIFQARILGWVAIPFSRGSSQLKNRTQPRSHTGQSDSLQSEPPKDKLLNYFKICLCSTYVW